MKKSPYGMRFLIFLFGLTLLINSSANGEELSKSIKVGILILKSDAEFSIDTIIDNLRQVNDIKIVTLERDDRNEFPAKGEIIAWKARGVDALIGFRFLRVKKKEEILIAVSIWNTSDGEIIIAKRYQGYVKEFMAEMDILSESILDALMPNDKNRLLTKLKHQKAYVRSKALNELRNISDIDAVNLLMDSLKDEDWHVRLQAVQGLGQVNDGRAVEPLLAMLKDSEPNIREETARALGNLKDSRVVEPLVEICLKDKYPNVSREAADALGQIGDKRAVAPLIRCLNQPSCNQEEAAVALGLIGDSRAAESLITTLDVDNMRTRHAAVEALGRIGDRRAVEPLLSLLKDRSMRAAAADALGRIKDPRAIKPLQQNLTDWYSGKTVAKVLEDFGWKPDSDEDKIHLMVARRDGVMLRQAAELAQRVLLQDIESPNYITIENALFAFIGLGSTEIIPLLIEKLTVSGNKAMAEAFLNCSRKELADAAQEWAKEHGYSVTSGFGSSPIHWGSF